MFKINNRKIFFFIIGVFLIFWWLIVVQYPSQLFFKKFKYKNFEINYNLERLDTVKLKSILDIVEFKTKKSIYFNKNKRNLFICNNKFLYTLFCPSNFRGLATNYVNKSNIFIAYFDLDNELSKSLFKDYYEKLDKLLAHEITHSLLKENNLQKKSKWIKEGYCEYIAYDKEDNLLSDYNKYLLKKDVYIKYRMVVSFLMIRKKMSLNEISSSKLSLNEVFKEIEKELSTANKMQ